MKWNCLEDALPEPEKLFYEIAAYLLFIILRNDSDLDRTEWQVTCSALIAIILILTVRKSIGFIICLVTYHFSFVYLFATGIFAPPSTFKNNRRSRLVEKMDNLERLAMPSSFALFRWRFLLSSYPGHSTQFLLSHGQAAIYRPASLAVVKKFLRSYCRHCSFSLSLKILQFLLVPLAVI